MTTQWTEAARAEAERRYEEAVYPSMCHMNYRRETFVEGALWGAEWASREAAARYEERIRDLEESLEQALDMAQEIGRDLIAAEDGGRDDE